VVMRLSAILSPAVPIAAGTGAVCFAAVRALPAHSIRTSWAECSFKSGRFSKTATNH
jgi:hypothetical protein